MSELSKTTLEQFAANHASSLFAWDLAEQFNLNYSGDCNAFDHGGTFYSAENWTEYGYADCIDIWQDPESGKTRVTIGTINRTDDDGSAAIAQAESDGIEIPESGYHRILCEIETTRSYWGIEQDYESCRADPAFDDESELEFWEHVLPLLAAISFPRFSVQLCDDGTIDTVADVTDNVTKAVEQIRWDCEYASRWRDESGAITDSGWRELCEDAIESAVLA